MKDRSKEAYYLEDLCLSCKHTWEKHFVNATNNQIWCGFNYEKYQELNWGFGCPCKNFTLDNLKHIEIIAADKNLI